MEKFTKERLVERTVSFWEPIQKKSIVTFSSMKKSLSMDKNKKVMLDSEVLFRRLLSVSKTREVDMRDVLAYELAAVPPSLFHDDGTFCKTNKADLAKKLKENGDKLNVLPKRSEISSKPAVYLIDGLAFLQG